MRDTTVSRKPAIVNIIVYDLEPISKICMSYMVDGKACIAMEMEGHPLIFKLL